MVGDNLTFLARQQQSPNAIFPLITEPNGMDFIVELVRDGPLDLIILDNFSTLGEVEDENAASSFNAIQQFLLHLKVAGVATMLVHHAGKSAGDYRGGDFRGSSKLAATFETIIKLERLGPEIEHGEAQFRVIWDKVRAGGRQRRVREVVTKLITEERDGKSITAWDFEDKLERLDEIKEALSEGALINQKEIADLCGVSKPMAKKYLEKGIRIGMWTDDQISRWFGKGQMLRQLKKTSPPVRPSYDWQSEFDEVEDQPKKAQGPEAL
jgi:AAA domain